MASHTALIRALNGPGDPLPLERVADYWLRRNLPAIASIAMASMMDPVGTAYDLPPLRIVGFQTGESQIQYQMRLHKAANAQHAKPVVEHAIVQHISELAAFCREEFIKALCTLEVEATFQPDRFAYLYQRGAR
jgi:hypothetical protein